jgi:uncharacterized protein involved in exopolysaccharide biosynthesis/Mrp family chromosome partitioning ATPase
MTPVLDQAIQTESARAGNATLGPPSSALSAGNVRSSYFSLDLARAMRMHRRLVLGFVVCGILLSAAYFLEMWPAYLAQSAVYVQPAPPPVLDQNSVTRWPFDSSSYESYIQQQMLNVTRTDVLAAALHKLGHGSWWGSSESEPAAIDRLRRTIEVTRQGSSYQFSIGVRASTPAVAAQTANEVTTSYIDSATGQQKAGDAQRLAALNGERDRVQKELAADRTEQQALNKQLGQAAVGAAAPDHYDDDINRLRTELAKARADHDEAVARYTSMGDGNGLNSASLNAEADELIATDPGLVSMKAALNQRRAALITQMATATPGQPDYKQDADELAKINASLDSMANELRGKAAERIELRLRADLERTADVEAQLNTQLGQLTAEASDATPKLQRSTDLVTDIARLQTRFTAVDEQWHNLMLEDGVLGSVYLVTPAAAPLHAAASSVPRNALLVVFASILLGILTAVIANKADPRVYLAVDVERVLGLAPLTQLPHFYEVSEGVVEEQLLRLSTTLEYARKEGSMKSCIFTGSGTGAGVTTVVTKVRAMLESMGRATVLVDASGIQPSAARANPSVGLGERLARGFAGTQRGSRPSALVKQMVEETETRKDSIVLTDTAPIVLSAETEYLARFVDCAIVVIESGVTTRAQLRDVAATLHRLNLGAVGFVLNRVELRKADEAFRESVQAIEDHLNPEKRSYTRRTVRTSPTTPEAAPADNPPADKPAAERAVEPGGVHAAKTDSAGESLARALSPQSAEQLYVPAQPSRFPPRTTRMPLAQNPAPAATVPPAEEPWWLGDLYPGNDVRPSKPAVEAAKLAEPTIEAVSAPTEVAAAPIDIEAAEPEMEAVASAEPIEIREAQAPAEVTESHSAGEEAEAATATALVWTPPAQALTPPEQTWTRPAQTWESLTARLDAIRPESAEKESWVDEARIAKTRIEESGVAESKAEPTAESTLEPAPELESTFLPELTLTPEATTTPEAEQVEEPKQISTHAVSRFDGLRNLINVMGLEKIRSVAKRRAPTPEQIAESNQEAARALDFALGTTAPDSATSSASGDSTPLASAQESLPFPSPGEPPETAAAAENLAAPSSERKPVQEESGLLPFRKGQYKQK